MKILLSITAAIFTLWLAWFVFFIQIPTQKAAVEMVEGYEARQRADSIKIDSLVRLKTKNPAK